MAEREQTDEFPSCVKFEPGGSNVAPDYYCRHCGNREQDHPGTLPHSAFKQTPSSPAPLPALAGIIERLRQAEIARLRATKVDVDYTMAKRHANAYLKALADIEVAAGLSRPEE